MNKLFSKVAALSVGLAMAIGVGVAVGSKEAKVAKADNGTVTVNNATTNTDGVVVVDIAKSSGSSTPITGDYGVRLYTNNTVTISSANTITSLTIPWTKNSKKDFATVTANVGTYNHPSAAGDGTWSGSAKEIVLTVSSSGQIQFNSVSYVTEGSAPVTSYTISYNANGGTGTMEPTEGTNPAVAECTFVAPNGMAFKEWNTSSSGTGTKYEAGAKPGADLSLYAIWEKAPSTVTFVAGTDTGSSGGQFEDTITKGTVSLYCSSWRNNDAPYRIYSTDLVISSSGENIVGVEFAMNGSYSSTLFSANVGSYDSSDSTKGVWSGDAASVTFTASAQARCDSIKVTLKESVDPSKKNMVIYTSGNPADGGTILWSKNAGTHVFSALEGEDPVSSVSWSTSDSTVATINASTGAMTTVKPGSVIVYAEAEGYNKASATVTISKGWVEELSLTGSMSKTSYYVGESWSNDGFTLTATYRSGWEDDVTSTATWTYNPAAPALNVTSVTATVTFGEEDPIVSDPQAVTVTRTNPIQALYSTEPMTDVEVWGRYVGFLDGTGPVIMDGAYGIVLYARSHDVSKYTVNETVLHVTAKLTTFNGLYELGGKVDNVTYNPTVVVEESAAKKAEIEMPVVYATKGGETQEYESRLTTVTGVPSIYPDGDKYGDFESDAGTKDIRMKFAVGTKEVVVFYKKAAQEADANAYAAAKAAVDGSSEMTIKGFTGWYNGFQVQMNGYIPPAEGYTAEDFAQDLLDQTDAVCAGWKEGDNNHDAIELIWSDLASNDKYPSLPSAEKTKLANAARDEDGTVVEQAMARYDYLTGRYNLSNFINGRTPIVPAGGVYNELTFENNTSIVIVISIATISTLAFTLLLVFKKKKHN